MSASWFAKLRYHSLRTATSSRSTTCKNPLHAYVISEVKLRSKTGFLFRKITVKARPDTDRRQEASFASLLQEKRGLGYLNLELFPH
uniref:Ribosomal protein L33 n=1 Tax=Knipowitschia caucasica TaxID=637954 RepID=A0AAV2LNF5_KNICA